MSKLVTTLVILLLSLCNAAAESQLPQCPAVNLPSRTKVRPSTANPQYVSYNGRIQALVGASASYLCHVDQPGTFGGPNFPVTPSVDYCAFNNYTRYIDSLIASALIIDSTTMLGLNKFQLWIGLNHSPGIQRRGLAYDFETPFQKPYNTNGIPDETFFARLKCVLDYAWSKDVIVEVTIFEPWEGVYDNSPWKVYFGPNEHCFASKDFVLPSNYTCETDPATHAQNRAGWNKQKELITQLVTRLCGYPNIYYQIANEVDFTSAPVQTWHQEMTTHLTTTETTYGCGHFVAANFHVTGNVDGLSSSLKAINAHYTSLNDARLGANELIRTRHNGGSNPPELNRIFGFNETKIVSLVALQDEPAFQRAEAARAEAWEFLLSEGGVYDLYIERWQTFDSNNASSAIKSLKHLNGLLNDPYTGTNLGRVQRSLSVNNALPAWISTNSSLQTYGTNNTRWGAMHSPMNQIGDANLLYIHHSSLEGSPFQRYAPQIRSSSSPYPAQTIYAILPAGSYSASWISPSNGYIKGFANFTVAVGNTPTLVPAAPTYTFDIALHIKRTGS